MTTYIVTRKSDGVEVYRYSYTEPIDQSEFPFATHDHTPYVELEPEPPLPEPVRITLSAFRKRITTAEKVAIELASLDVPSGSAAARQAAAELRVWWADINAAPYIVLISQDTIDEVQTLEDYGLLAAGRALEILETPPTDEEVWNG